MDEEIKMDMLVNQENKCDQNIKVIGSLREKPTGV